MERESFEYILNELDNIFVKKTLNGIHIANDGDYNHLINKPKQFDGDFNHLKNIPNFYTFFDGTYNSLKNKPDILLKKQFEQYQKENNTQLITINNMLELKKIKHINITEYYNGIGKILAKTNEYVNDTPFSGETINDLSETDGLIGEVVTHMQDTSFQLIFDGGYLAPLICNLPLSNNTKISLYSQYLDITDTNILLKRFECHGEIIKQEEQNIFRTTIFTKNLPLYTSEEVEEKITNAITALQSEIDNKIAEAISALNIPQPE